VSGVKKLAISKNYYYLDDVDNNFILDDRIVSKIIEEKDKSILESGLEYNDIETKILIFEDRINGWFLDVANKLKENNEAGFVIVMISLGYVEGIQQYVEGAGSDTGSKDCFVRGIKRIFTLDDRYDTLIENLYKGARCGLFHNFMTSSSISISGDYPDVILFNNNVISINPHKFIDCIRKDFEKYVEDLKNKENIVVRSNFEKRFSVTG
jgi:hypothetical protein